MAEKLTTYDPAAALVDDEEVAVFMANARSTGGASYIAHVQEIVARARADQRGIEERRLVLATAIGSTP